MFATTSESGAPSPDEGRILLEIARRSLRSFLGMENPSEDPLPRPFPPGLEARKGLFISLHRDKELRGCVGILEPVSPLHQMAAELAVAAASRDPRFLPVQAEECPHLTMEISVLSPAHPISSAGEIRIGRDGLLVSRGEDRGVLLPQVATEHGWSAEEFLRHAFAKAGLADEESVKWSKAQEGRALVQTFSAALYQGPA
ncbi:MAG: AmmeMemoRadiSam system protein A [Acidobacteriota bacterium]